MASEKPYEKKFTKSAFNQSIECPMRAYYYRNSKSYACHVKFPDGLAEVGDQFGALARVYEGVPDENIIRMDNSILDLAARQEKTINDTINLLRNENVNIAEAAFGSDTYLAYVDILHKRGDTLEIIEVKSKDIHHRIPR